MKTMNFSKDQLQSMATEMGIERERAMEEGNIVRQRKAEAIIIKLNALINFGGDVSTNA